MSKFMKLVLVITLTLGLAFGSLSASGFDAAPYKLKFGDPRWQTKFNAALDALAAGYNAVASQMTALSALINNWAIEDNIVTLVPVTPTYVDADTFTVPGDYTSRLTTAKRVQVQVAAGMVYSTVASSSYGGGLTTVNLNDAVLTDPITCVYVVATRDGLWPNGPGYLVARDYGSPGQATLVDALTVIGSDVKTLRITDGAWALTEYLAIPDNVTLEFAEGAYFDLTGLPSAAIEGLESYATTKTKVTWAGHGLTTGDYVTFNNIRQYYPGVTPTWQSSGSWMNLNNLAWQITKIDDNSFSVALNSSYAWYSPAYDPVTDPGTVSVVIKAQCKVVAGLQEIFHSTGNCPQVWLDNTVGKNFNLYPEWFGAVGDNVTDDLLPLNRTIAAANMSGGAVVRLSDLYYASDTVSVLDNQGKVHIKGIANSLTGFRSTADGYPAFEVLGAAFCEFADFIIVGNNSGSPASTLVPSVAILEGRSKATSNSGSYSWTNIQIRGTFQYGEIYNQGNGLVKYNNIDSIAWAPPDGSGLNNRKFATCMASENLYSLAGRNGELSLWTSISTSVNSLTNCQFTFTLPAGGGTHPAGVAAHKIYKANGIHYKNVYTSSSLAGASGSDIWVALDPVGLTIENCQLESNHRYTVNISSSAAATVKDIRVVNITGSSTHENFLFTDTNTNLVNSFFQDGQLAAGKILLGGGAQSCTFLSGLGLSSFKVLGGNFQNNIVELPVACKIYDTSACGANAYNNIIRDSRLYDIKVVFDSDIRVGKPESTTSNILYLNHWKIDHGLAAPTSGSWSQGDIRINSAMTTGQPWGWGCILDNTFGTLNGGATTGAITTGTGRLSVSSITDLLVGNWLDIAGVTGPLRITNILYKTAAIEGLSQANPCVVSHLNHGLVAGDSVKLSGITQADWSGLNATHLITYIDTNSYSIPVNTSGFGTPYAPATDPGVFYVMIAVLSGNADATVGPTAAVSFHNHSPADAFKAMANLP